MALAKKRVLVLGGSGFIGTYLLSQLSQCGYEVTNFDLHEPDIHLEECRYILGSVLDATAVEAVLESESPDFVIILAASTEMNSSSPTAYLVNTLGTEIILSAVAKIGNVSRVIVTSTQHVFAPGSQPNLTGKDFSPYQKYGASKAETERITQRFTGLNWIVIRPTTIWGPGHPTLPDGLWKFMKRGYYLHPSHDNVIRCYGYVANTAWQIVRLLEAPERDCLHKIFYLGDFNMSQSEWLDSISRSLTGKPCRRIPVSFLRLLSVLGGVIRRFNLPFPLYPERFENLTTSNEVPLEPTLSLLGQVPISFEVAQNELTNWLKDYYLTGTNTPIHTEYKV